MLIYASSFSQQTTTSAPKLSSQDYLQKAKKQRKTGYILLGSGGALIITSLVFPRGEQTHDGICIGYFCSDEYKNDGLKSALFITGGVAALSSIPFFITAGKNRRKASAVSFNFKVEDTYNPYYSGVAYTVYPALRVKVGF